MCKRTELFTPVRVIPHFENMEKLTEADKQRIEQAMETTYRRTIYRLMAEADTEECRKQLEHILSYEGIEWED